jgi:RNA polymerase sigma-70 factor (ECF subfamily)
MQRNGTEDTEEMLRRARTGEGDARGQLFERYRPYLALLARVQIGRQLAAKVDADDLVQETFLQAHHHFAHFQGTTERELTSWLRQILATNLALLLRRYLGTRGRDVRLERQLADELDQSSQALDRALHTASSSPSHKAARREQAVLLAEALGVLPEDYREVIVLRHLEELSFPDVAQRMGRSLDSVKNLWARALVRLRGALGEGP